MHAHVVTCVLLGVNEEEDLTLELLILHLLPFQRRRHALAAALGIDSMARTQTLHELLFWERSPPLAILAAADIAQVSIEIKADPKYTKDSLPTLLLHAVR